jgi:diacylglycerol diphosphate phosphatase/phosphatidate phosphatase
MLGALVPIFIFLVMQIRIRSFWDVNNAVIGLLYSLITAAVFQVFLKWLIGGLRPHFLAVCKPVIPPGVVGTGYQSIMFDSSICTGDKNQINDSLESFPSGHSTAAFAGFVFLYLYLNAKLKVWSNYHPAMWKLIAVYAPILAATLIAGALTIDEFHNWYDCLAGAIIGTIMAFSAYRMVYASIWDFRVNHIPLTRNIPYAYGAGGPGAGGFETAVFTRKAEWGHESAAMGGAPFDMSANAGGSGTGFGSGHTRSASGHTHSNGPLGSNGIGGNGNYPSSNANTINRRPVGDHMV